MVLKTHTIYFNPSVVPLNYQDTESNRYDTEVIEYDIVDQKLRMWGEEDHVVDLSRSKGNCPICTGFSCITWFIRHSR